VRRLTVAPTLVGGPESEVAAPTLDQFVVRAGLDDLAMLEEVDPVGVPYRPETMGDLHDRLPDSEQPTASWMARSLPRDEGGSLVEDDDPGSTAGRVRWHPLALAA
jgi:hypothetical protein